jgi:hypothetical protein
MLWRQPTLTQRNGSAGNIEPGRGRRRRARRRGRGAEVWRDERDGGIVAGLRISKPMASMTTYIWKAHGWLRDGRSLPFRLRWLQRG